MSTTPGPGVTWKREALSSTLGELPHLPLNGTETGNFSGLGETIYAAVLDLSATNSVPKHLATLDGSWKGEVEVRSALRVLNPPLKRSAVLRSNSGRYSEMMVVNAAAATSNNPTGMVVPLGLPNNK